MSLAAFARACMGVGAEVCTFTHTQAHKHTACGPEQESRVPPHPKCELPWQLI